MDIRITGDSIPVLFHDDNTKRVTGQDRLIHRMKMDEVKDLNAGHHFISDNEYIYRDKPVRIPQLETVFKEFPETKILLDLHTGDLVTADR